MAEFIRDVSIPDKTEVIAGQSLVKTWAVKNTGATAWPEGSKLIFVRGDRELLEELEEFPAPRAAAGETVEVSVMLRAPPAPGRLSSYFSLANADRVTFGKRLWVDVVVVAKPEEEKKEQAPSTPTPTPVPVAAFPPKFHVQLEAIRSMGFTNQDLAVSLLEQHEGNLQKVVLSLLTIAKAEAARQ